MNLDPTMIRKLQGDLRTRIDNINDEMEKRLIEGTSGGGVVKVIATGRSKIVEVKIGKDAIDPSDPEMLQDLIMAATNQALERSKKVYEDSLSEITGGLHFPGLF